jgi:hypothetical protein
LKIPAFGLLNLTPEQFYSHTLADFHERAFYCWEYVNRDRDFQMQKTAWQTAILMNSSGNYKKKIKPEDLYKSPYEKEVPKTKKQNNEDKEKVLADLKEKFGKK